ncbi:MAG TPA: HsdR family type I site-specific deoxyribonuclease, partial [Leptospiraceae bacterium]|nr:HsdR family type I site-specific deoxyribonuclease [Leptospiraceae bacterium]
MSFNELNSVENYIIYKLSEKNLNAGKQDNGRVFTAKSKDRKNLPGQIGWVYKAGTELERTTEDIFVESELKEALVRINPEIKKNPDLAEEIIYKLRAVLISVNHTGLVKANEEFSLWLKGEKTLAFGKNNQHIPIKIIDYTNIENNSFIVTNQYRVYSKETKIPDIVMLINGIPVAIGEAKTPIRPSVSWLDGASDIHDVYENAVPQLFVPNIFSFATDGKELFYGSVRCPLEHWTPWRIPDSENSLSYAIGLKEVGNELNDLLSPFRLLDILQNFAIFSTDKKKRRIKVVARYQQYEGANRIVERVKFGSDKKGLIWHFQGSGKSLLMLFAAGKLRRDAELKSPTVIILVDRVDLDTQITGTFNAADIPNLIATDSIKELHTLLEQDTRKVIITTIFKFKDSKPNMNLRDNIIVLVDEAHRTQEGNLGRQMRAALPNAYLFGLTGTPINKSDKNTFWAFGSALDTGGYMSRYTFQDSIRDKATLKLHFEPRLLNVHVDKESLDKAFKELTRSENLTDEEADALSKRAAKMSAFLKSPERIEKISEDISKHFREKVEPHGFKAMVVAPDREGCELYEKALTKFFNPGEILVVISTTANDSEDFKNKYYIDKDELEKKINEFNDSDSRLKLLIVTARLLTGFDSPILQTMYLDKSLKDHTLLQAICRTNRLYPKKTFGRIVDYFGLFDDAANALQFDEESVKKVITNLETLKEKLEEAMQNCLSHFPGVDRTIEGFEGLEAAQECINTNEKRDKFAGVYSYLNQLWESLSPDSILNQYNEDYRWLSGVYQSVKPISVNIGKLLWHSLGAKTTELIHKNIKVSSLPEGLTEFVLDADVIEDIFNHPDPKKMKDLEKALIKRFQKNKGNPKFVKLSERLEKLKEKAEQGLINSIDFLKELCQIARDTVKAEKDDLESIDRKDAKSALTELFLELKTDKTPAVVERIVNDIDEIVKIVRFDGWQTTVTGERAVQQSLRKALLKYKLHKDQSLFDKAYEY